MSKSLTSIWLRGLTRLARIQAEHAGSVLKRPAKPRAKTSQVGKLAKVVRGGTPAFGEPEPGACRKPSAGAARTAKTALGWPYPPAPTPAHESRVRPRAAAWAKGAWSNSFFSAPPTPGNLVNHLAYGLYLPTSASVARAPLVVMLHGCKQSAEDFAQGTRMNLLADQHGFAVLYPEQSKHAHPHRCWHWYDSSAGAGGGEAASIAALVEHIVAAHDLDASRVYLAGMSAGAGMANLLALQYPHLFAAVGLHSGVTIGAAHSAIDGMTAMSRGALGDPLILAEALLDPTVYPGMPAFLLHGEQDGIVAPVNLDQLEQQWARLNGLCDASGQVVGAVVKNGEIGAARLRDYVRRGRRVLRVCRVAELGHAWSGGDDALPFHSGTGPEASELLWEFFKHQRRTQPDSAPESMTTGDTALDVL